VNADKIEGLNHLDMLKISSDQAVGDDEEDEDLVEFEKTTTLVWRVMIRGSVLCGVNIPEDHTHCKACEKESDYWSL
jgi:hypothetical protein